MSVGKCIECGRAFEGKRADALYCSSACSNRAYRKRNPESVLAQSNARRESKKVTDKLYRDSHQNERKAYLDQNRDKMLGQMSNWKRRVRSSPEGHVHYLVLAAKARSKKRGLSFDLSLKDLLPLPSLCSVLGIPIVYGAGSGRSKPGSPSLDRIVPARGYVAGNVRVISARANELRRDGTAIELALVAADAARIG